MKQFERNIINGTLKKKNRMRSLIAKHDPHTLTAHVLGFLIAMVGGSVPARDVGGPSSLVEKLRHPPSTHRDVTVRLQHGWCGDIWRNVLLMQVRRDHARMSLAW